MYIYMSRRFLSSPTLVVCVGLPYPLGKQAGVWEVTCRASARKNREGQINIVNCNVVVFQISNILRIGARTCVYSDDVVVLQYHGTLI